MNKNDYPDDTIFFYEDPHYYLSNFSAFQVEWRGQVWPTVEHAYQAAKFIDTYPTLAEEIRLCRSAHVAMKFAHEFEDKIRPGWHSGAKADFMEQILRAKIAQHEYVRRKLLETGSQPLVENSPKDSYWGRGPDYQGQNMLGTIWMKLRTELIASQA